MKLVWQPPHLSVSSFMGYLKSKISLMIFDKHANLKYKYGNSISGVEDIAQDTLNFKEYTDPFTGEPVK